MPQFYLDCQSGAWRPADMRAPQDVRQCAIAQGRCKSDRVKGIVLRTDRGTPTARCSAAVIMNFQRMKPIDLRAAQATIVHEYAIHCGLRSLGSTHRERIRAFLADRIPANELAGWFPNGTTERRYRKTAAHHAGFEGALTLPTFEAADGTPNGCRASFKSESQARGYRYYAEEALAALVSAPLSTGTVTALAARGPGAAFAARLAMHLDAFAAGIETSADVLQGTIDNPRPLLPCGSPHIHITTGGLIVNPDGSCTYRLTPSRRACSTTSNPS